MKIPRQHIKDEKNYCETLPYAIVRLMLSVIDAVIRKGKIIPTRKISLPEGDIQIKIFAFPPPKYSGKNAIPYFGKLKGTFGDGLKFQKKLRNEWS